MVLRQHGPQTRRVARVWDRRISFGGPDALRFVMCSSKLGFRELALAVSR